MSVVTLSEWGHFHDYIKEHFLDYPAYIFRGQASHAWSLQSRLDRVVDNMGVDNPTAIWKRENQLSSFRMAVRGKRGPNPPNLLEENDWWALGQHFGLATPLLDFTESPFVALYFAFAEKLDFGLDHRAVWAISRSAVQQKSELILIEHEFAKFKKEPRNPKDISNELMELVEQFIKPSPHLKIVNPNSDENARLVSQRGLFVRTPDSMTLENWVKQNFKGDDKHRILIKILIPNKEREKILTWLNRMNINHLSLFPDLYGAAKYCNMALEIPNY